MKKIICSIELFDLYQSIQIADTETGKIEEVTKVPRDDLEETLAAISYKYKIPQIIQNNNEKCNTKILNDEDYLIQGLSTGPSVGTGIDIHVVQNETKTIFKTSIKKITKAFLGIASKITEKFYG